MMLSEPVVPTAIEAVKAGNPQQVVARLHTTIDGIHSIEWFDVTAYEYLVRMDKAGLGYYIEQALGNDWQTRHAEAAKSRNCDDRFAYED